MSNYVITYDLNGSTPTHAQMDAHIRNSGAEKTGRILETVWYIKTPSSMQAVYKYVNRILSTNDRVIVVEASDMMMRNLLVQHSAIQNVWAEAA